MNFIHKELNIKYNLIIGNLFNIDKDFRSFYHRNKDRNKDAEKARFKNNNKKKMKFKLLEIKREKL